MREDKKIRERVGHQNSFDVPNGYFEHLPERIMSVLPDEDKAFATEKVSLWLKVRPWVYMAALFVGAALIIRVASGNHRANDKDASYAYEEVISDEYLDISLEKAQMGDYALYVYLTENGGN